MKSKMKILYVDDEIVFLENFMEYFEVKATVKVTSDPFASIDLMREFMPDLIIADQKMPHMNGLEVLKRSISVDPDARRIVLTAAMPNEIGPEEVVEAQPDLYLRKPLSPEAIEPLLLEQFGIRTGKKDEKKNIELLKAQYNQLLLKYEDLNNIVRAHRAQEEVLKRQVKILQDELDNERKKLKK